MRQRFHELPGALARLLSERAWGTPGSQHSLRQHFGAEAALTYRFLSEPQMQSELSALKGVVARSPVGAQAYYLSSSRDAAGTVPLPRLDVEACIPIIMEESDPFICLDYRCVPPRVVLLGISPARERGWFQIAAQFDDFARRLTQA